MFKSKTHYEEAHLCPHQEVQEMIEYGSINPDHPVIIYNDTWWIEYIPHLQSYYTMYGNSQHIGGSLDAAEEWLYEVVKDEI